MPLAIFIFLYLHRLHEALKGEHLKSLLYMNPNINIELDKKGNLRRIRTSWMRSSLVVRASDCQCRSRNSPGFDPSILRHSVIWGAADEAVLNTVHTKKIQNISQYEHMNIVQWPLSYNSCYKQDRRLRQFCVKISQKIPPRQTSHTAVLAIVYCSFPPSYWRQLSELRHTQSHTSSHPATLACATSTEGCGSVCVCLTVLL